MSWFGRRNTDNIYNHSSVGHSIGYHLKPKSNATSDEPPTKSEPKKKKRQSKPKPDVNTKTDTDQPQPKHKTITIVKSRPAIKSSNKDIIHSPASSKKAVNSRAKTPITKDNFI